MKKLFIVILVLVVVAIAVLMLRPAEEPVVKAPVAPVAAPARSDDDWFTAAPRPTGPEAESPADDEYSDIPLDPEAIASLREARLLGYDPRTPPIARGAPREEPTADELADPEKYAEYETRQDRKLKRAYVNAAGPYLQQLRADIDKGKAYGIPPEEIAKVQEKVRRIEAMRAQLLAEDPQLLDENSAVPRRATGTGGLPVMRPEGPLGTAGPASATPPPAIPPAP